MGCQNGVIRPRYDSTALCKTHLNMKTQGHVDMTTEKDDKTQRRDWTQKETKVIKQEPGTREKHKLLFTVELTESKN